MKCLKCWRLFGCVVSFQRLFWCGSPEFSFGNQIFSLEAFMLRKILVINWFLNLLSNYRAVDWKFTPQLMAVIIRFNNRDAVVGIAKVQKSSAYLMTEISWNRSSSLSLSETVFFSCKMSGKLSGTSLLTNKVSRGTLIINHLPELHKESWRD